MVTFETSLADDLDAFVDEPEQPCNRAVAEASGFVGGRAAIAQDSSGPSSASF